MVEVADGVLEDAVAELAVVACAARRVRLHQTALAQALVQLDLGGGGRMRLRARQGEWLKWGMCEAGATFTFSSRAFKFGRIFGASCRPEEERRGNKAV